MKRLIVTALVMVGLTGCASFVQTSSTTFHGPEHTNRGSVAVLPIDKTQDGSLEFRAVDEYLSKKLIEKGYVAAQVGERPMYSAFITYGIDNGTTSVSSVPIYGQTGGGTSYTSGSINSSSGMASYSGSTIKMPTYGVVGAVPVSSTEYKRKVNVDIWRNGENPVKVYEMRDLSSGSCGNISSILFAIIDGMFDKFPGENGKTNSVNVEWKGGC